MRKAQRVRFKVFYEDMAAVPDGAAMLSRRDVDPYDRIYDPIGIDRALTPTPFRKTKPKVVGTYRLLRQDIADLHRATTKEQSRRVELRSTIAHRLGRQSEHQ